MRGTARDSWFVETLLRLTTIEYQLIEAPRTRLMVKES